MPSLPGFIGVRLRTAVLLAIAAIPLPAQEQGAQVSPGLESVTSQDIYEFCKTLASPRFAGRLTGHSGYTEAARWIGTMFDNWGLKPLDTNQGHLQPFPTEYTTVEQASMSLLLPAPDGESGESEVKLEAGRDFLPLIYSDSGDQTGQVVFAGWGIHAPELNYDDYAGIEVKDRFVLCFRGTPDPSDPRFQESDEHRTRMRIARQQGALGLIYIYDEPIANPNGNWIRGFTPAVISQKTADLIFKERALQASSLRADLQKYKRPISFPTRARVRLTVQSVHVADGTGYNIVGVIEGDDPTAKSEYVVVGGHADHCGYQAGLLFPGANDNASGTAAVMGIAKALASNAKKPRRSVVIALFGGEESGLKGSEFFARHLPPRLGKPVAMLNFDMVGEGDGTRAGFSHDRPELDTLLAQADAGVKILRGTSPMRRVGVQGSDFAPFFAMGIPCISFSSNGPHLQYHQSGDSIYRVNPEIMADTARLGYLAAVLLADR